MHVEPLLFLTKPNVLPICENNKPRSFQIYIRPKFTSKNSPGKTLGFHYALKSTDINTNGGKPLGKIGLLTSKPAIENLSPDILRKPNHTQMVAAHLP